MSILVLLLAYFIGSFPSAYIAGKLFKGIDIRTVGSNNMGATNVWRSVGKFPAILTLCADIAKGALTVACAQMLFPDGIMPALCGAAAIFGHSCSVFMQFKGGKSVATSCGVFLMLAPTATMLAFLLFVVIVGLSHYISVGSICAACALPLLAWYFSYPRATIIFAVIVACIVIIRHKQNIVRLIQGSEHRFMFRK